jgi:phosphotransferase system, enzyme I, PtsP
VSEPWEFEQARNIFMAQRNWLADRKKKLPVAIRYGAMLEVPALAETLDLLLPHLDFLSIGTNDLTQFLFAADRAHPKLAERYDWLSPAILRFLARVTTAAKAAKVPVGVCGEMGGRPLEAMALIGLGVDRLSITPAGIGPVKAMIRSLNIAKLRAELPAMLANPSANLRSPLDQWATTHSVVRD